MEKPLEVRLWRFTVRDERTGRVRTTRYRLTEAEALERYGPTARKVPGTDMVVSQGWHTSDWLKRGG